MRRRDLEQHLRKHKCLLLREGSKHSVYHSLSERSMLSIALIHMKGIIILRQLNEFFDIIISNGFLEFVDITYLYIVIIIIVEFHRY